MADPLPFRQDGPFARLTADRPGNGNMMTLAMVEEPSDTIDRAMPKSIGWLVYSTAQGDAQTARMLGFVRQVVPAAELGQSLDGLPEILAGRSREALITCKSYLTNARLMETEQASDHAGNLLALVMSSK